MQTNKDLERRVLEHVNRQEYKPVKPRVIAKQLKLTAEDLQPLKRAIKRLVKSGQLAYGPKHIVLKSVAGQRKDQVIGRFSRAAQGYGFVSVVSSEIESDEPLAIDDIYIPQRYSLNATSGDLVRIKVQSRRQGDRIRTSGRILEIIERRTNQFVGTYLERGEFGLVAADGGVFEADILVGDAGAKNCRLGDKVIIEMVRFPGVDHKGSFQHGEAVITQVLGDRGQPGVDTLTIIAQFGLPGEFPEAVLEHSRSEAEEFDEAISDGRVDMTDQTVITIDPRTARDFDDAISLQRIDNGHWQLGVHIADVSHFVQPHTELDNEAFRRATSVYLADRVIPMLPEIISNNLASLQPDRVRYTMTALIEFTEEGVPIGATMHRAAIKSSHRFNYEEIDDYLENDRPWKKKLEPGVFQLVRDMHGLAMKLRQRRMKRGSLDLMIPEVEIDLDEDGKVCGAHTRDYTESHQVIEEFMLAANEAVAQHLVDLDLNLMRRIHEPPVAAKLADLKIMLRELGYQANDIQSRFELKRIIDESRDTPESHAVHFAILRCMQKAIYGPKAAGHYALASQAYCHFTSPIRRYPDLVIHRMIGALIDGKRPASDFQTLQRIGGHCSDLEQRAEQAERELVKLKLINYLAQRIGDEFDAVVTGVEAYGLFAQGLELPATGFIPLDSLPGDEYFFDRGTRTLTGFHADNKFRLGDPIRIRVVSADPDRRELEFALVAIRSKRKKKFPASRGKNSKTKTQLSGRRPKKHK